MNDELSFELLTVDDDEILVEPVASDAATGHPATVLIVDDDAGLRRRFRNRFWNAGYQVREAANAHAAYEIGCGEPIDVALVDTSLPDTDGWGLLSVFRDDVRLNEIKIVLMSGQRALLAELSRVHIGADGYVAKTGDIVTATNQALARRLGVVSSLAKGAWGPLADVGVQTLLQAACQLRLYAMLSVDDGVTTWRIAFNEGVIASARAYCLDAEGALNDHDALTSLLDVGNAPFMFEAIDSPIELSLNKSWSDIAPSICAEVNRKRARTRAHLLALPRHLAIDVPRFRCWARRAPAPFVAIGRVLLEGAPPSTLLEESSWPRTSVEFVVTDLVRRGVVLNAV